MRTANGVTAWARTADGWALNLDGSDAAVVFSLPRLEVRSSAQGWRSLCLLPNGTLRERAAGSTNSVVAAKAAALEQAGRMLGPVHAAALAALLATPGR
jgi:hypothetical protein